VKFLTNEELGSLPTPRLLAYYKKYRHHCCFIPSCDCCYSNDEEDKIRRVQLRDYLDGVKLELDKREHVG
jgi:hypothetical protein